MAWAQVKKKKPYADYDLRPRPMAWAQVKKKKCTLFILNTHPINRLSKAGATLVNSIASARRNGFFFFCLEYPSRSREQGNVSFGEIL